MVRQRVLYGSLLLVGLVAIMLADAGLSRATPPAKPTGIHVLGFGGLSTLGFTLIVIAGTAEICRLCRQAGHRPATPWAIAMSALFMIAPWLNADPACAWLLGAAAELEQAAPWLAVLGTAVILVLRQRTQGATADFGSSLLAIFYVGYLGSYCVRLRCWFPSPEGAWIVLATLFIIKLTDIGAYFTGMAAGRTLLIPKVSPKKTWEGLIGGTIASAAAGGLLFGWVLPSLGHCDAIRALSLPQAIVFGIVMAVSGQFGDLAESLFKRDGGAKDSARLVPTFGGVLDVIDSPLLAVPVAYWLLRWWLQG